jgi:hypothetical protein
MSYYTTDICISRVDESDLGLAVTARTGHVDQVIQCYVSGELAGWRRPEGGSVRFVLPQAGPHDVILLLAVDPPEARTDYWDAAFAAAAAHGNRIRVRFRRDPLAGWHPGDRWCVRRGDAGDPGATIQVHEADIYPGGRAATGWGFDWGHGCWGLSGSNAPGWGTHWGYTWGFGIDYLEWVSDPLPRGTYPVSSAVIDRHGNESTASETLAVVDSCARPASRLAVAFYTQQTDTLQLSVAPSEDISQ